MRIATHTQRLLPILLLCSALTLPLLSEEKNAAQAAPHTGIAWRVQGAWLQESPLRPVKTGDPIVAGSLLRPAELRGAHSITFLLPDGQRILNECFTEEDCARGFRVPALNEVPSAFALRMLQQMRLGLARASAETSRPSTPPRTTVAKLDEALAVLDGERRASVSGLLATLPLGSYTYDLRPLDRAEPTRFQLPLAKTAAACVFPLPGPGGYDITLWDAENTPRIRLFLAAIDAAHAPEFSSFPAAGKQLAAWNEQYYGWPTHELLRAYLVALLEQDQPSAHKRQISSP